MFLFIVGGSWAGQELLWWAGDPPVISVTRGSQAVASCSCFSCGLILLHITPCLVTQWDGLAAFCMEGCVPMRKGGQGRAHLGTKQAYSVAVAWLVGSLFLTFVNLLVNRQIHWQKHFSLLDSCYRLKSFHMFE